MGSSATTTTIRERIRAAITPLGRVTAEPEPDWFLKGYIAPGAATALFAKPKVGKTTLLFDLLRALRTGSPWAGLETRPARVLYLSEEGRSTLGVKRTRFELDGANGNHVHFVSTKDAPGATWADWIAVAVELRHQFDLVVVDTYGRFAGFKGEEANGDSGHLERVALLDPLLADGLAVLLVAHERKSEGSDITDAGKGGNAFTGAVDVAVFLRRVSSDTSARTLESVGRFDDHTPDTWHIRLDGARFVSTSAPQAPREKLAEARLTKLPNAWTTAREAAPLFGVQERAAKTSLDAAHAEGALDREGAGTKSDPYRYKRAAEWSSSSPYPAESSDDGHRTEAVPADSGLDHRRAAAVEARCRCDLPLPSVAEDGEVRCARCGGASFWNRGTI